MTFAVFHPEGERAADRRLCRAPPEAHTLYSTPYYVGGLGFFFGTVGLGELRV